MKIRALFAFMLLFIMSLLLSMPVQGETLQEYVVKAGYIYRFMLFTEWPESAFAESSDKIIIGIYGPNPFSHLFEQITDKKVQGRKLVIKYFPEKKAYDDLVRCHVLFISREAPISILSRLKNHPVLTISDRPDFIEHGGMIEFQTEDSHIRFSINRRAARKAGISFSAQLLKIALKVVE
jgi:hypothetical protein